LLSSRHPITAAVAAGPSLVYRGHADDENVSDAIVSAIDTSSVGQWLYQYLFCVFCVFCGFGGVRANVLVVSVHLPTRPSHKNMGRQPKYLHSAAISQYSH